MANRATIGNMSPEFGSTCAIFPIDAATLEYLRLTGRPESQSTWSRRTPRSRACGTTRPASRASPRSSTLDLSTVVPSHRRPEAPAGPDRAGRRQDRVPRRAAVLHRRRTTAERHVPRLRPGRPDDDDPAPTRRRSGVTLEDGTETDVDHGHVVIAAITSCTNTSNPFVMVGAALLAKKAVEKGLPRKPWVKTTLAPGSKVVMDYYERAGPDPVPGQARLQPRRLRLHHLHRQLRPAAGGDQRRRSTTTTSPSSSVLSGNRNFEGRINPDVKMNYLASPPLVVAYALAGTMDIDLDHRAARHRQRGQAGLPRRHLALPGRGRRASCSTRSPREMFTARLRRRVHGRRQLARPATSRPATRSRGPGLHLRTPPAVLRRHARRAGAGARHRRAPGCSPCSATR